MVAETNLNSAPLFVFVIAEWGEHIPGRLNVLIVLIVLNVLIVLIVLIGMEPVGDRRFDFIDSVDLIIRMVNVGPYFTPDILRNVSSCITPICTLGIFLSVGTPIASTFI